MTAGEHSQTLAWRTHVVPVFASGLCRPSAFSTQSPTTSCGCSRSSARVESRAARNLVLACSTDALPDDQSTSTLRPENLGQRASVVTSREALSVRAVATINASGSRRPGCLALS